ncbi:hypothetical protein BGZ65_012768, partial [Modicella reniformis]
ELLAKKDATEKTDLETAKVFLSKYVSTPAATQAALSRGWQTDLNAEQSPLDDDTRYWLYTAVVQIHRVYKQEEFRLPTWKSESWYMTKLLAFLPDLLCAGSTLVHQPGEVQSKASVLRKNADRNLWSKWVPGRKIDSLFACQKTEFELGALEATRTDAGMQTTKALSDTRKLGKLLKDMHDCIRAKACKEIQDDL